MTSIALSQETLDEKKVRADALFKEKKWSEAEPVYASIISNTPKNHDLNFRYGTCLLNGSKKIEDAIVRLRYSVSGQGIDARAYYYLGRAYHLNYQFNDAIKQYDKFKQVATANQLKDIDVETDIKACGYGKRLLANVTDMVVLNKTEIKTETFYDLYDLDDIGGQFLVTDMFQSKLDKKRNHRPMIHFPSESPYIYYSSYGDDGATGLDIYVKQKLPGGEWSLAQKVRGNVNTYQDEAFAYMHPNGQYLYFCSRGHNSMGGYDVFRSRYNPNDQTFGKPENLDFAISSPDDDLLFVVDSLDRMAYFSSARESSQGKITVYKVRVDRIPMQMAIVKGNFLNTIDGSKKEIEIEVIDFSTGRTVGKYNSKATNGDYLITFPRSGKYRYYVTEKGSDITDEFIVELPYTKELKPLKQSLTLKTDDQGQEYMELMNRFGEEFDDPVAVLAEVYRELSILPPNSEKFNLDSLDALKETDEIFVDAGLDPFITDDGLETILADVIEDLTFAKTEEEKQMNIAYNLAQEKSDLANEKMVELNDLIEQAENVSDPKEKNSILKQVLTQKDEIEDLNNEAQSLIELAESIEASIADKEQQIETANEILDKAKVLSDGDRVGLTTLVGDNKSFFEENVKDNPPILSAVTNALQDGANEQKRVQELSAEISDLSKNKRDLIAENKILENQLKNEKKKKIIAEIQQKIADNESDISVLENSISNKSDELDEALKGNDSVRSGIAAALVLKDDYSNSNYEKTLSDSEKREIAQKVQSNNLEESLALVDDVLEENNVSAFNIDLYANNEETSGYSLEQWNDEIDKEAERLRQEKLKASAEKQKQIQEEIDRLERLRQEKIDKWEVIEEDPKSINPEINQDDIVPNYTKRKQNLDEIVNEGDRKKAAVELNYEVIKEIAEERNKLEEILADDPKAKNVQERLKNLDILEREIKADIEKDEEWIVENNEDTSFNKDELLTSLDPNYQRKINDAYEIIDEDERNKAISDLNEVILEKSNERIQELQAILASDPDNKRAKEELVYLEELVDEIGQNKEQPLVEPTPINVDELSAEVDFNDLIKNYDSKKKVIDGIKDEYSRKQEENKLYNELIDAARSELVQLDKLAVDNPANKNLKKRQDALRDIDRDYNKTIAKNNDWLDKNKPVSPVYAERELVHKAYPEYQREIDRINKIVDPQERNKAIEALNETTLDKIDKRLDDLEALISQDADNVAYFNERDDLEELRKKVKSSKDEPLLAPTDLAEINTTPSEGDVMADYNDRLEEIDQSKRNEVEKENERIILNEELIQLLDDELEIVENLITENPDDAEALNERKETLESLKDAAQDKIEVSRTNIENAEVALNRPGISVGSLMPDYEQDLADIASSNKTTKDKLTEENNLHNMLLAAVDYKIDQLETERGENPDLSETINNEIDQLKAIKQEKQDKIEINKTAIANADPDEVVTRPTISIGNLMSDYESQLASIKNGGGTDVEKMEEENELHQKLIDLSEEKIEELNTEKEENPEDTDAIDNDIAKLNEIKSLTQDAIDNNKDQIAEIGENDLSRPTISVGNLMKDYESQLTDIKNGSGTDVEKMEQENQLHQKLIDLSEAKIEELNNEKETNPENADAIDKDIAKLNDIKRSTQNAININKDQIAQLGGNELDRPTITIGSLIPGFEKRMAEIEESDETEQEKLAQKNALNKELLNAIENKIYDVQEEWEEDPTNGFTYNQEIDKLEELKESKRNEVARNQEQINALVGDAADVADVKPEDFNAIDAQNAVAEFDKELNEIKDLNTELDDLNEQLNAADSDKQQAKIQKSIDKVTQTKAKLENEVIEGLEEANNAEATASLNDLQQDRELADSPSSENLNGYEADLNKAEQNLIVADQKLDQAKALRLEAEKEKDALVANDKLKQAYQLETEAKDLIEESKRIFRAGRVLNMNTEENVVITDVPENVSERKSTAKFDEAAALREKANEYYDRANELRDSSATVKKKDQNGVLALAEAAEVKADLFNAEANDVESIAEDIKAQEEEVLENQIAEVEVDIDAETTEEVVTSDLYEDYYKEKNAGDAKLADAAAIDAEIEEVKNTRVRRFRKGVDATKKDPQDVVDEDPAFSEDEAKIDSLLQEQKRLRDEALANYNNAKAILNNQSIDEQENIMALEQRGVEPVEPVAVANADFDIPDNIGADIFRTTDVPVYSEDAPIPVNSKQPSGLVYKVQVGAFRNPLPQDHFKEFAPISGEQLNNGITRYMVGYFTTFDPANEAKGKVNGIGYGDAFVVAYCNGERITIERAKLIEQGLIACEGTDTQDQNDNITIDNSNTTNNTNTTDNTNNTDNSNTNDNTNTTNNNTVDNTNTTDNSNTTDNTTNNNNTVDNTNNNDYTDQSDAINTTPTTPEEQDLVDYYTSVPNAAEANQVEIIKGLFYTVQIGVYSKPVPNSALFNIQPLNSQRTDNGFVRYSTGVFTSEEAAVVRKDEVVGIGITDAFVTAYFNGERITPEEALQILVRDGASALVGSSENSNVDNQGTGNTDSVDTPVKEEFYKEGLYYRILVGKYEDAIPGEYATLLLQGDGIFETEVDEDGKTCLISNKLDSYEDMIDRLSEFADLGIEDMDIVTYYKYDVIPFEEGEKIRTEDEIETLHPYDGIEGVSANTFIYKKEAVYFKVKLGEFEDKVPTDFTNLLLLHEEDENINKEETINDETIFATSSIASYKEAEEARKRLLEKGFDRAVILAYHKYDEISVEKAKEILGE